MENKSNVISQSKKVNEMSVIYVVLAFRYSSDENTFPIGAFQNRQIAEVAAKAHREFRGGKYNHRIYEFVLNRWDDDVGHVVNNNPCIERD